MYTFLTPPEDIGIPCQQEEFDLNLLAQQLENGQDPSEHQMEELERIPLFRKIAAPAHIMDLEEIEDKICEYCQLWKLYAETSVELKRKSKLSWENTVAACKVYSLYISDVLQQVNEVMKLFAKEKELRIIKNRGHFPVPEITPQGTKIENTKDIDKALDKEVVEMIRAVRESEQNYEKEKEEARNKEQQVRLARQTNRSDFNFLTMNSSTPTRNNNMISQTSTNQQTETAVHFNPNTICHFYPTTDPTSCGDRYKPPANNSIIQGADSTPGGQFATSTTGVTGCNEPWRYNNGTNTATCTSHQTCTTRPSVIMVSTTTRQTLQTIEMALHASDVESKAT